LAESGIDGVEICRPNAIGGTSKTSKTSRKAMPLLIIVQRVIPLSGYMENVLLLPLRMRQTFADSLQRGKIASRLFARGAKPVV